MYACCVLVMRKKFKIGTYVHVVKIIPFFKKLKNEFSTSLCSPVSTSTSSDPAINRSRWARGRVSSTPTTTNRYAVKILVVRLG